MCLDKDKANARREKQEQEKEAGNRIFRKLMLDSPKQTFELSNL